MSEPLDLLIYEVSYRRVAERLRDIARALRLSIMDKQGAISVNGSSVPVENVCATVGWPNSDIFAAECRREYFRALLKSETMKWVQSAAAGFDDPVFGRLSAKGIILTNSDAQGPAIADFVLGAALDFYQEGDARQRLQAARSWQRLSFRELADTVVAHRRLRAHRSRDCPARARFRRSHRRCAPASAGGPVCSPSRHTGAVGGIFAAR